MADKSTYDWIVGTGLIAFVSTIFALVFRRKRDTADTNLVEVTATEKITDMYEKLLDGMGIRLDLLERENKRQYIEIIALRKEVKELTEKLKKYEGVI